jgi:hypothetical protein
MSNSNSNNSNSNSSSNPQLSHVHSQKSHDADTEGGSFEHPPALMPQPVGMSSPKLRTAIKPKPFQVSLSGLGSFSAVAGGADDLNFPPLSTSAQAQAQAEVHMQASKDAELRALRTVKPSSRSVSPNAPLALGEEYVPFRVANAPEADLKAFISDSSAPPKDDGPQPDVQALRALKPKSLNAIPQSDRADADADAPATTTQADNNFTAEC